MRLTLRSVGVYLQNEMADPGVQNALAEALARAREELSGHEDRASELRQIIDAIQYTLRLDNQSSNGDGEGSEFDWLKASRPAAIQRALAESPRSLSPKQIHAVLAGHGRTDGPRAISAALSRLKTDRKVTSAGYARWKLTPGGRTSLETEERLETA